MNYLNKITGEVLPFKTQFSDNPILGTGTLEEMDESRTVQTDFEDLRSMVTRIKKGEIHLLGNIEDDFVDEKSRDSDDFPLEVATPEELFEDVTDTDTVKQYAQVLSAETSERSAGNHEAQKAPEKAQESDGGQASDNGARADDVASVGS